MNRFVRLLLVGITCAICSPVYATIDEDYLRDAQAYFAERDFAAAIIQLKNLLQRQPESRAARTLLARTYLEQGDGVLAEKELETALSLGAGKSAIMPLLGHAWLLQGKPNKVLQEIPLDGEGSKEAQAELYYLHGKALFQQGDLADAEARFADALTANPRHVDTLIGQARLLFVQGNPEGAEERVQRALELENENVEAWVLGAELKRLKGEPEAALDRFERALSLRPNYLPARLGRATVYATGGKYDLANQDIEYVLQRSPKHPLANYLKALARFQQGKLKEAEEALQLTLGVLPDHAQAQLLLGTVYYRMGQYNQSVSYLEAYARKFPENIPAIKLYAASLIRTRQTDAAITVLESAVAVAPEDAQLMGLLGSAYFNRSDADKGIEYLQRAAELAPDEAAIQTQLAVGHLMAGNSRQAADDLQQAVDLGQGLLQADVMLVLTHLKNHDFDKAVTSATNLVEKLPDNAVPHNLLGTAYLQKSEPEKARMSFERALQIKPDFYPAASNLARMDIVDGHPEKARSRYQDILGQDKNNLDAMFGMAELARSEGDLGQMVTWLDMARKAHPETVKAGVLLGDYYLKSNMPLKALDVARELVAQRPDHPDALRTLGLAQMASDSSAAAVSTMRRLVELLPDNPEAQYLLASAAMKNNETSLARTALKKVLALDEGHAGAMYSLGSIHLLEKNYDEATHYAEQLSKQYADQPWGYALAGEILAAKAEFSPAAEQARLAYERERSQQRLLRYHALMVQASQEQRASALLDDWLKDNPDDAMVHLLAAMSLQGKDNNQAATRHYEKILAVAPDHVIALNNLAWIYLDEKPALAVGYAKRAYQASPEKPEVLDTYGWVLVQNGQVAKGLPYLQDALVKAPHLVQIRYHTAVALHKVGRDREARLELGQALRSTQEFEERPAAKALYEALQEEAQR